MQFSIRQLLQVIYHLGQQRMGEFDFSPRVSRDNVHVASLYNAFLGAYTFFANKGAEPNPQLLTQIRDNMGRLVVPQQVSDWVALLVSSVMSKGKTGDYSLQTTSWNHFAKCHNCGTVFLAVFECLIEAAQCDNPRTAFQQLIDQRLKLAVIEIRITAVPHGMGGIVSEYERAVAKGSENYVRDRQSGMIMN